MNGFTPIAATPIASADETVELVRVSADRGGGGISYTVNRVELGADLLWDDGSEIVWDDDTNIGGEA
jgi:hypothetical protein